MLSAKDPSKKAHEVLAKRIGRQVAYARALGIPPRADLPALDAKIAAYIATWDGMVRKKAPMLDSFAKEGTSLKGKDAKLIGPAKAYLAATYPTSTCKLIGSEKHGWRAHGDGDDHVGRYKYVAFDRNPASAGGTVGAGATASARRSASGSHASLADP